MKKRVLCLFLSLCTLLSLVLTGCNGEEEKNEAVENKHAMTITVAMIKGEGTTDEACDMVEKALNVITESRLNTHIEISFFTADEYEEKIYAKMNQIGNNLSGGGELAADGISEEDATEVETKVYDEETGREIIEWPAVSDNQFDIVFMDGIDMFYRFSEREIVMGEGDTEVGMLTEIAPTDSVRQYLNSKLLETANTAYTRLNMSFTGVYAIPNNRDLGQYTYIVANKELVDKYLPDLSPEAMERHKQCVDKGDLLKTHTVDGIPGITTGYATSVENLNADYLGNFLTKVHENHPDMTLVQGMPAPENLYYTFDSGVNVGAGSFISAGNKVALYKAPPANTFSAPTTQAYYKLMWQLKQWGQTPTAEVDFDSEFAVAYVKGNFHTVANIDTSKYYVKITEAPVKSNENVYDNLFGVTKYSISPERATEVVELFNTNKEFRNTLYYGIEDVHYMVNDHGEREFISDDWNMDMFQTGNLFLLEPASEKTFIDELGEADGKYYYQMSQAIKREKYGTEEAPTSKYGYVYDGNYEPMGNWGAGKLLNRDAVDGLLLNFYINPTPELKEKVESLRAKCAEWNQYLLNYTGDDISGAISEVSNKLAASEEFNYITRDAKVLDTKKYDNVLLRFMQLSNLIMLAEDAEPSVLTQYLKWYDSMNSKSAQ